MPRVSTELRITPKAPATALERAYRVALRRHLKSPKGADEGGRIGRLARRLGVGKSALARIHERSVSALSSSGSATREASFLARALAPIEETGDGGPEAAAAVARRDASPSHRARDVEATRLAREVARRRALAEKLAALRVEHRELTVRSRQMEARLRDLSRRLLAAHEDERLRISRELHDAIGQTLTGINVGLASLKQGAATDSRDLAEAITLTQQLVERSMKTVHQFAWELRPTLLDDLGIVPALRSYARLFAERTGIPVAFESEARFARLDSDRRVAIFRVAQGALSNVERHARAAHASVSLRSLPGVVRLEVRDDGRSFDARRTQASKTDKHLGLIVMRERVEMVGGRFSIASSPGRGTMVRADVPLEAGDGAP